MEIFMSLTLLHIAVAEDTYHLWLWYPGKHFSIDELLLASACDKFNEKYPPIYILDTFALQHLQSKNSKSLHVYSKRSFLSLTFVFLRRKPQMKLYWNMNPVLLIDVWHGTYCLQLNVRSLSALQYNINLFETSTSAYHSIHDPRPITAFGKKQF